MIWWSAATALAIVLAIPFLLVDVPAVLDYPNHLARFFVLAHQDDPVLAQMYAPNWRILPNIGMDVLGVPLLRVLDVHFGGRLLLALSLFAPVVGVIAYHRAVFERRSLWPLASGMVAYNGVFFLGFMNFLLAIGLALCAAAGWIVLRRRRMVWTCIAFGAVAGAVTFLCHIFGVLFFALLIGAYEADRLWAQRRSALVASACLRVVAMIGAALSPALLLYALCPVSAIKGELGSWSGASKIWGITTPFMTTNAGLTLTSVVTVLSLLMLLRRQLVFAPGLHGTLAVLIALFIAVPQSMATGTWIDVRFALMAGLLLFAGIDAELQVRQAAFASLMIGALILARSAYVGVTWIDHRQDLAEVRAAIAAVEPGMRVLAARGHPGHLTEVTPAERALPGVHRIDGNLAALLVIERRAFWPQLFAHPAQQPLIIRPPYNALVGTVEWSWLAEAAPSNTHHLTRWRTDFDAVLLLDPAAGMMPVSGLSLLRGNSYAQLYLINHALSGE